MSEDMGNTFRGYPRMTKSRSSSVARAGPRATRWAFFFVWTMLAMGVSGSFAAILALPALWRTRLAGMVNVGG